MIATGVKDIRAGLITSFVIKVDNSLWGCGENYWHQISGSEETQLFTLEQMLADVRTVAGGYRHTVVIRTDGSIWGIGENSKGELGDGTTNPVKSFKLIQFLH